MKPIITRLAWPLAAEFVAIVAASVATLAKEHGSRLRNRFHAKAAGEPI